MQLKEFLYKFDEGPFITKEELLGEWSSGNCRRMLQLYFFVEHKIFFRPDQILCPKAYYQTGRFVFKKGQKIDFEQIKKGDVIYAERIRSKDNNLLDKGEKFFINVDDYITSLHTAIYEGNLGAEILHANFIEGKSCFWSLEKFLYYYIPVAVKRVI